MASVYLETTVIGHLVGRIHPDTMVAARQLATRRWWKDVASEYDLYVSELVIEECSDGDSAAAEERLAAVQALRRLQATAETPVLAAALVSGHAIPASEPRDAFHVALAAVNEVEYLMTWNFKHIANANRRSRIESVCREHGFHPPTICTPSELTDGDNAP